MRVGSIKDERVAALRREVEARQAELDAWVWDGDEVLVTDHAAGALRRGDLHPARTWLALAAAPAAGPEDLLPLVAEARWRAGRPLKLRTWDVRLLAQLALASPRALIESHLVTLDRDDRDTARWMASTRPVDLTERAVDDPFVATAAWVLYRRIHAWDPVAIDAERPAGWCDDLVAAATLDGPDGRPIAVVCAHRGDPTEAAFVGCLDGGRAENTTTAALVAWLLQRCGRVQIEADEGRGAHPSLVAVLRAIPNARWAEPLRFIELV